MLLPLFLAYKADEGLFLTLLPVLVPLLGMPDVDLRTVGIPLPVPAPPVADVRLEKSFACTPPSLASTFEEPPENSFCCLDLMLIVLFLAELFEAAPMLPVLVYLANMG